MSDLITGTIRTVVPSIVSTFALFMAARGFELDEASLAGLESFLVGIAVAAYYVVVRLLGKKFPWAESLLGSTKKPEYKE